SSSTAPEYLRPPLPTWQSRSVPLLSQHLKSLLDPAPLCQASAYTADIRQHERLVSIRRDRQQPTSCSLCRYPRQRLNFSCFFYLFVHQNNNVVIRVWLYNTVKGSATQPKLLASRAYRSICFFLPSSASTSSQVGMPSQSPSA